MQAGDGSSSILLCPVYLDDRWVSWNAQRETEGHLKDIEETILQNLAKMNATKRKVLLSLL